MRAADEITATITMSMDEWRELCCALRLREELNRADPELGDEDGDLTFAVRKTVYTAVRRSAARSAAND